MKKNSFLNFIAQKVAVWRQFELSPTEPELENFRIAVESNTPGEIDKYFSKLSVNQKLKTWSYLKKTPLSYIGGAKSKETMEELKRNGFNINQKFGEENETLLMRVLAETFSRQFQFVLILIQSGIDIESLDKSNIVYSVPEKERDEFSQEELKEIFTQRFSGKATDLKYKTATSLFEQLCLSYLYRGAEELSSEETKALLEIFKILKERNLIPDLLKKVRYYDTTVLEIFTNKTSPNPQLFQHILNLEDNPHRIMRLKYDHENLKSPLEKDWQYHQLANYLTQDGCEPFFDCLIDKYKNDLKTLMRFQKQLQKNLSKTSEGDHKSKLNITSGLQKINSHVEKNMLQELLYVNKETVLGNEQIENIKQVKHKI